MGRRMTKKITTKGLVRFNLIMAGLHAVQAGSGGFYTERPEPGHMEHNCQPPDTCSRLYSRQAGLSFSHPDNI